MAGGDIEKDLIHFMAILTDSQKKAHDLHRHLSVTANAGSGKTTVLVNRFVDILQHTDARIQELVAITFTDKAASELRRKIAGQIEERIHAASDSATRQRLEESRDQLSFANIGTIHAFCAKLLREHPVEAQVDAAFTVLEGIDQEILEREVLHNCFEDLSRAAPDLVPVETTSALQLALRVLGRRGVERFLRFLLRKREQIDRLTCESGVFSATRADEQIIEDWERLISGEIAAGLDDQRWREAMRRLLAAARGKRSGEVAEMLGRWRDDMSLIEKETLYNQLISVVLTVAGTVNRRDFLGKGTDASSLQQEEDFLRGHRAHLAPLCAGSPEDRLAGHRMLVRLTRALLAVYGYVLAEYERSKAENGLLDFEDLLLRARTLLSVESVRTSLARRFKFIMVDEYQDTNTLQYEILRPLVSHFDTGNLFIVGDPKQSIYGFRNADVEIFERTKRDIAAKASEERQFVREADTIVGSEEESPGEVHLSHSFRLLTNLVAFVNLVFSRTMGQPARTSDPFDVGYEELIKSRQNDSPGTVELMLVKNEGKADDGGEIRAEDSLSAECEMIARRILVLHESRHELCDMRTEAARPFRYGDAAILMRSRTHLVGLERALEAQDIPYLISGGIGFYQTQEIYDFYNYFKFLLNLHDDVALVGVLRSPFFSISDAELFEVSLADGDSDFWSKTKLRVGSDGASEPLKRACSILQEDLLLANRLSIPLLVQRIVRKTGWIGTVAGIQRGEQTRANVLKLLRTARDFEDRGFGSMFDFVSRLKTLLEEEEREGQASLDVSGNCVQVMTIHAAKGLEFPVVFVPFCDKPFRFDAEPFLDAQLGLGFKVVREDDFEESVEPPIFRVLSERSRLKRMAEEKRIFYVACTRARDMLVISGRLKPRSSSGSYLRWILDAIGKDADEIREEAVTIPQQVVKELVLKDKRYESREQTIDLEVRVLTSLESLASESAAAQGRRPSVSLGPLYVDPVPAQTNREFFSATQVKTFLECPSKYFLRYRLGLPEQNRKRFDFDQDEDANDRILGEIEGSLTHRVLERINSGGATDEQLRRLVDDILRPIPFEGENQRAELGGRILRHVKGFTDSEFGRRVMAAEEFYTEHTINTVFEENYLTGTIDRLYRDTERGWCIIDYKTDHVSENTLATRAESYRPQLAFYALLVSKYFEQPTVFSSLVFTTLAGSHDDILFEKQEIRGFERSVGAVIWRIASGDFQRTPASCPACPYQVDRRCLAGASL